MVLIFFTQSAVLYFEFLGVISYIIIRHLVPVFPQISIKWKPLQISLSCLIPVKAQSLSSTISATNFFQSLILAQNQNSTTVVTPSIIL